MTSGETSSYRIGEERYRDAPSELARLRVQAEVAWPQELRALERHGLRDDAAVLEAGCGPGFVTSHLLEFVQRGSVTALDVDQAMVAHARELVGSSERARFVEAGVAETGLPADSFDVVLARFVLQHLPDPGAAIEELRRVLRPGGRLIVVDADDALTNLFDPEPPFFRELMDAVGESQRRQGGNRLIGRRLPRLLGDAGFFDLAVDAVVAHSAVVGLAPIRSIIPDHALDYMEAAGVISAQLSRTARDYLARIDSGEEDLELMLGYFVVSGSA